MDDGKKAEDSHKILRNHHDYEQTRFMKKQFQQEDDYTSRVNVFTGRMIRARVQSWDRLLQGVRGFTKIQSTFRALLPCGLKFGQICRMQLTHSIVRKPADYLWPQVLVKQVEKHLTEGKTALGH